MKRVWAIAVSLVLVIGLSPGMAFASSSTDSALTAGVPVGQAVMLSTQADELDLTQSVDETYSFTSNGGSLYWTMSKAGIAYVNVKVEGVSRIDYSSWYARGASRTPSDLGVTAGNAQVSADGIDLLIRCSGKGEGEIDFLKAESDKGSDTKVTLHVTSTFKPVNASAKSLSSGASVDVIQAAGDLYWPVKLKKACKVTLNPKAGTSVSDYSGISLCNSKKKALEGQVSGNKYTYVVPKGTYYVRTRVSSSRHADEIEFSLTTKSVGNFAESTNTTRAKAAKVSLGKKATGFIGTSNPEFKAHYYKLTLKKATTLSVTWKNGKGVETELSILNKKGKELYGSSAWMNKGKIEFYHYKDTAWKNLSKKVTLSKGTYYLKVTGLTTNYGAYTFTAK